MPEASNLILIDKPKGITSFDVIRVLRRKLGIKKMGHAGTLDPRATGLLIIATGSKTKELNALLGLPKTYNAKIQLGMKTDTGDLDGKIIEEKLVPDITLDMIRNILMSMQGDIALHVPLYSAVKKQGKKLYSYAHEGKEVELPTKIMHIVSAEILHFNFETKTVDVSFHVKSGTYIRSLAEEFGRRLGTVATLAELRRTRIGEYILEHAQPLESFPVQP